MLSNIYITRGSEIATSISGGRPHFDYRKLVKAIGTYTYELAFGENFHTLSMIIFGTDEYYWVIADLNKPMDAFALTSGTKIQLPEKLVRNISSVNKIF